MTGPELVREIKKSILRLREETYGGVDLADSQAEERARNIACWLMGCKALLSEELDTVIRALALYSRIGSEALNNEDRIKAKEIALRLGLY
jgi:hypothetical protein